MHARVRAWWEGARRRVGQSQCGLREEVAVGGVSLHRPPHRGFLELAFGRLLPDLRLPLEPLSELAALLELS